MSSSRRSISSTNNRSSFSVPRKTHQSPSISVVFAEPEQSSPLPGSAAARLTPRLSIQNLQERKRDSENATSSLGKPRVDGVPETRSLSGSRLRSGTVSSVDIPRSKSWFPFRRSPSKQSLRSLTLDKASVSEDSAIPRANRTSAIQTPPEVKNHNDPDLAKDSDTISLLPSELRRRASRVSINKQRHSTKGLTSSSTEQLSGQVCKVPLSESPDKMSVKETLTELEPSSEGLATSLIPSVKPHKFEIPKGKPTLSQGWFGSFSGRTKNEGNVHTPQNETGSMNDLSGQTSSQTLCVTSQALERPQLEDAPSTPLNIATAQIEAPAEDIVREPEPISTHKSETLLSTMNPSMSRLLLSVPLLRKPKAPVEVALNVSEAKEETVPSVEVVSVDTPTIEISSSDPPVVTDIEAANEPTLGTRQPPVSWWSLVGLASRVPDNETNSTILPDVNENKPLLEITCLEEPSLQIEDGDATHVHSEVALENNVNEASNSISNPCVQMETANTSWLSPYGWYEWYSMTKSISGDFSTSDAASKDRGGTTSKTNGLSGLSPTNSIEGFSRLENLEINPSESGQTSVSQGSVNPISVSLAMNSRSWASFFSSSSRVLTTKLVAENEEKSVDTMEVMMIDDEAFTNSSSPTNPSRVVSHSSKAGSTLATSPESASPKVHCKDNEEIKAVTGDAKPSESRQKMPNAPLTSNENVKRRVLEAPIKRTTSPTPSKASSKPSSPVPRLPNLVLPTFNDTFHTLPRSRPRFKNTQSIHRPSAAIKKTINFVSNVLLTRATGTSETTPRKREGKMREIDTIMNNFGKELPKAWNILSEDTGVLSMPVKNVVIIGIHGWFPGYAMRTVIGEPTGTSAKFANMMELAVEEFAEKHGIKLDCITKIPLEGEGKIRQRVDKLFNNLISNDSWVQALRDADVIFVATHSQGSIVSTHLISRLIKDGYINTVEGNESLLSSGASITSGSGVGVNFSDVRLQRVCCLALCGIHLGPLAYLQKSSFVMPYIQYFESEAASELFEFQNTESRVSQEYAEELKYVLDHRVKFVYIASLNDQVVPVYSGAFTAVNHPLILRALYIDGDAYNSSDFLSNLLVLLFRIRNAGLSDGGLLAHLSEATAGSLNGVGHSTAYEELASFSLAVDYLFLSDDGSEEPHEFNFEPFNARATLNDYEIPWSLRDLIADERVVYLFAKEFSELRDAFNDWHPRTAILRDLKRKLEPIRRLKLASRL